MKSVALLSSSLLYLYFSPTSAAGGSGWEYNEGEITVGKWAELVPECGGQQQSPIDVVFQDDYSAVCDEPLILDWHSESMPFVMQNAGLSLKATPFALNANGGGDLSSLEVLHHTNDTDIRLPNQFYNTYTSPVNKEYCFDSLHFHWGRNNSEGSEHTYNGKAYPLEVHFVHYSCDYLLLGPAVGDYLSGKVKEEPYDDQHILAVIGVVFEIGEANPVLDAMLESKIFEGIKEYNDPTTEYGNHLLRLYYTEFDMNGLLPDDREFLAYRGSLTTPPCLETVRWHNMKTPMTVSQEQMDKFRALWDSTGKSQAPNYRPPQPRYNRRVYQCKEDVLRKAVEKDVWSTAAEEENTSSPSSDDDDNKKDPWPVIGVMFIFLTFLAVVIIVHLYKKAYYGKGSVEEEAKEQQQLKKDGGDKKKKEKNVAIEMQQSGDVEDENLTKKETPEPEQEEEERSVTQSVTQSMDVGAFTANLEDQLKAMETRLAESSTKKLI